MAESGKTNILLKYLKMIISPESKPRRVIPPGFQKEGVPFWAVVTILLLLYQVLFAGKTYTLFLPDGLAWGWQELRLPVLDFWTCSVFMLYMSGVCLFPRVTIWLSSIVFSAYFLYGAANGGQIDLLLGFGEPLYLLLSPILPAGTKGAVSWLWGSIKFPSLQFYAFQYYLPLYIFFTGILTFLCYPARDRSPRHRPSSVDIILFLIALSIVINYVVNFADRGERAGIIEWHDVIMGILALLISVEMCRRMLGWVLPGLGILFCLYAIYGNLIPGRLNHAGFAFNEVMSYLLGSEGVFGVVAGVYASYVFLFILFGVFLEATKVGDVFVKLSFALVGHLQGGPAKAAVVSSGLVGMICGSGAPNIVITGTFTIPMMKKAGFKPHFAAAVEAVASIGGILMPPVMGSVAFLVAAFTETDYSYIALISFVPACMYYYQCYMSVHNKAGMWGIHGMPRKEMPRLGTVIREEGYLLLPVFLLVIRLVMGRSPFDAALWSLVLAAFVGFFREDTRIVGLPPLIARGLGLPGWRTDVDQARVRAEYAKAALLRANRPFEEVEAEYRRIVDEAMAAPRRGLLRENWMIGAGAAVFCVLIAAGSELASSLFWGIAATFVLSSPRMVDTLEKGAMNSLIIGVTAGVVGVMLAGISLPGLGMKFPSIVISYSKVFVDLFGWTSSELPIAILLVGAAAYVMGMGMTSSAVYVLLSVLAVPALVKLGVPVLSAHLLTLWFTITAPLTPPFALGAFVAAGLAGADPMKTGFAAVRLAWALYIVPFLIAYQPILMNKNASWAAIGVCWVTAFMGFYCSAAGLEGFSRRKLKIWERLIFLTAAFLLYSNGPWKIAVGTVLMALGIALQRFYVPAHEASALLEPTVNPKSRAPRLKWLRR
jgi:TRAP transporter 4TM/12TM fusion protein